MYQNIFDNLIQNLFQPIVYKQQFKYTQYTKSRKRSTLKSLMKVKSVWRLKMTRILLQKVPAQIFVYSLQYTLIDTYYGTRTYLVALVFNYGAHRAKGYAF